MGTHFHPIEFLKMSQEVYEKVVVDHASGVDVPIEYKAFTKMLGKRTTIIDKMALAQYCSDFSTSPSHPPRPINSLSFMTAANTCVSIAFQDERLALTRC
jgi:hypothetical protein